MKPKFLNALTRIFVRYAGTCGKNFHG